MQQITQGRFSACLGLSISQLKNVTKGTCFAAYTTLGIIPILFDKFCIQFQITFMN